MEGRKQRVGYWMTEKKIRRLNFDCFETICRNAGIDLVKIDFDKPLEQQGPFAVILHKLTDEVARTQEAPHGEAVSQIQLFQQYTDVHPEVIVIDPVNNVMKLLNRRFQYEMVKDSEVVGTNYRYFIPSFVELTSSNVDENKRLLRENDVRYPFVCKPTVSHLGAATGPIAEKEEMAIIFNEKGLVDIEPPCIAQSFVNHNARLFKVFVIGQRHFIIQRPSIKNFYDCNRSTIFFNSNDVSKSNSSSFLNQLEDKDLLSHPLIEPDCQKMDHFVRGIQNNFGLDLLGIDVIIENDTGRYAVIDINAFPGYDGVPEFFNVLLQLIIEKIKLSESLQIIHSNPLQFLSYQGTGTGVNFSNKASDSHTKEFSDFSIPVDADKNIVQKHTTCNFRPPDSRFIYGSAPTQLLNPALCMCYAAKRNPASSINVYGNRMTNAISSFSVH